MHTRYAQYSTPYHNTLLTLTLFFQTLMNVHQERHSVGLELSV